MLRKILVLLISLASIAHAADEVSPFSRDRKITDDLIDVGYPLRLATVPDLIRALETGPHPGDEPNIAYENLEEFMPFSERTAVAVLDSAVKGFREQNEEMNYFAVLMWFRTMPLTEKPKTILLEFMRELEDSEEKRIAIEGLSRYAEYREECVGLLVRMLSTLKTQPLIQIAVAFDLIALGEHEAEAEQILIDHLGDSKNAKSVFFYVDHKYFSLVSDELISMMDPSIFPTLQTQAPARIMLQDIKFNRRKALEVACVEEVISASAPNVVSLFPKKD